MRILDHDLIRMMQHQIKPVILYNLTITGYSALFPQSCMRCAHTFTDFIRLILGGIARSVIFFVIIRNHQYIYIRICTLHLGFPEPLGIFPLLGFIHNNYTFPAV